LADSGSAALFLRAVLLTSRAHCRYCMAGQWSRESRTAPPENHCRSGRAGGSATTGPPGLLGGLGGVPGVTAPGW